MDGCKSDLCGNVEIKDRGGLFGEGDRDGEEFCTRGRMCLRDVFWDEGVSEEDF